MTETELFALVQQALGLTVLVTAPVALAALLGALAASMLGLWTGLTDPVVGLVARALAVILAVVGLFAFTADQVETLARAAFTAIGPIGRIGAP